MVSEEIHGGEAVACQIHPPSFLSLNSRSLLWRSPKFNGFWDESGIPSKATSGLESQVYEIPGLGRDVCSNATVPSFVSL